MMQPSPMQPSPMQPSLRQTVQSRLDEDGATKPNSRKPFLLGLLTGIVLMLLLGQVFRAAAPSPDYAQVVPPPMDMTITADDDTSETFLDMVENANSP
jgi:hypothetical protein